MKNLRSLQESGGNNLIPDQDLLFPKSNNNSEEPRTDKSHTVHEAAEETLTLQADLQNVDVRFHSSDGGTAPASNGKPPTD